MLKKRDVLLQDITNLNYTGLCKDNKCKFKMKINGDFPEVVIIEKKDENNFILTKLPPLVEVESNESYQWAEECLYHLAPDFKGVNYEMRGKILNYFGE